MSNRDRDTADYHSLPAHNNRLYDELINDGVSPFAAELIASTEFEGIPVIKGEPHGRQAYCHAVDVGDVVRTQGQDEGKSACEEGIKQNKDEVNRWYKEHPNWRRRK